MNYKIAVIPGDGIGPEIIKQAIKVLKKIETKFLHKFELAEVYAGGAAIDKFGTSLPQETMNICHKSNAVLLGAVGGYKWDTLPGNLRPENALLELRKGLGLYANLRPAIIYDELKEASPIKLSIIKNGIDIMVVRELIGGIYFGQRGRTQTKVGESAYDTECYNKNEIERIAKIAFECALKRNKKVTSIDKANVLESSRLWRETVTQMSKNYDSIELNHMYIDNAAMQLIKNPQQFDVILTNNMFGDILSDEASQITGSIGMLPSSSLGENNIGMYEPIHGSAPDIAGKDIANPIATILSLAMMFKYSFNLEEESGIIEQAVHKVLKKGYRTTDILSDGMKKVGTSEMGDLIVNQI